ncbi:MAG: energy transducer TonB [Hyphomicrobiaceae bacterium]|nr:energy transducer TonB [Hyphomicrobiaceae bacterium]
MNGLRTIALVLSLAVHGAIAVAFIDFQGGRALEAGSGNDLLRIEQGIALEGLTRLGDAPETIEAREVIEQQASEARPELEEIKAAEVKPDEPPPPDEVKPVEQPPEVKDVISSPLGPTQEIETAKPLPELERPQPKQVATEEQVEQVAVLEQKAASSNQEGGDATLYRAYLGSIRTHIERFKVKPRTLKKGTVVIQFSVNRDGEVTTRTVATSSGNTALDEAALAAVDKASPFPKFPEEFRREKIVLSIPFIFETR